MYTMKKDLSHDRLLAKNLSYYFAYGGRRTGLPGDSASARNGPPRSSGSGATASRPCRKRYGNCVPRAQATVLMETSMKGACKHLKAALGVPPC